MSQIISLIVIPLLIPLPIALKLVCAHIFTKFEFRTQTFRLLKINSVIDALLLLTLAILAFIERQELLAEWTNNKYLINACQMSIMLMIGRCLETVRSSFNIMIVWNQYKNFKNMFYVVIGFAIAFSVFQLPIIFLNELENQACASDNSSQNQSFNIQKKDNIYIYGRFGSSFILLLLLTVLNFKLQFKNWRQRNSKFKSIVFTRDTRNGSASILTALNEQSLKEEKRNLSLPTPSKKNSTSFIQLPHFRTLSAHPSHHSSSTLSRRQTRFHETKTSCMTSWITNSFLLDQLLRISCEMASFFLKTHSNLFYACQTVLLLVIILNQLLQFFIYYKLNDAFNRRFKELFKKKDNNYLS